MTNWRISPEVYEVRMKHDREKEAMRNVSETGHTLSLEHTTLADAGAHTQQNLCVRILCDRGKTC